jgi:hypothetical protein
LGFAPIAFETPEGRAEYETHQRLLAETSEPLRRRLAEVAGEIGKSAGVRTDFPSC